MRTPDDLPAIQAGLRVDVAQALDAMPSSRLVGLRVLGFSPGGHSAIELPLTPALTFDGRTVQAGIVGLLADYAGVAASASLLAPGWRASTTGFQVHNLAPAIGERLLAAGRCVQFGKTSAVSTVEVWAFAGGRPTLVAVGTTTCRPFDARPPV